VQLHTLAVAELDEAICNPRKVAAWFAFFSEAKTRPSYQNLCWARDDEYLGELHRICGGLVADGGYAFDPRHIADSLYAMQDGLWLRLMMDGDSFTREDALATALGALGALFPQHFDNDGRPRRRGHQQKEGVTA
jgi:TetR/AcrR family transcriptional repressor of bet genes